MRSVSRSPSAPCGSPSSAPPTSIASTRARGRSWRGPRRRISRAARRRLRLGLGERRPGPGLADSAAELRRVGSGFSLIAGIQGDPRRDERGRWFDRASSCRSRDRPERSRPHAPPRSSRPAASSSCSRLRLQRRPATSGHDPPESEAAPAPITTVELMPRIELRPPVVRLREQATITVNGVHARSLEVLLAGATDTPWSRPARQLSWRSLRLVGGAWHGTLPDARPARRLPGRPSHRRRRCSARVAAVVPTGLRTRHRRAALVRRPRRCRALVGAHRSPRDARGAQAVAPTGVRSTRRAPPPPLRRRVQPPGASADPRSARHVRHGSPRRLRRTLAAPRGNGSAVSPRT